MRSAAYSSLNIPKNGLRKTHFAKKDAAHIVVVMLTCMKEKGADVCLRFKSFYKGRDFHEIRPRAYDANNFHCAFLNRIPLLNR